MIKQPLSSLLSLSGCSSTLLLRYPLVWGAPWPQSKRMCSRHSCRNWCVSSSIYASFTYKRNSARRVGIARPTSRRVLNSSGQVPAQICRIDVASFSVSIIRHPPRQKIAWPGQTSCLWTFKSPVRSCEHQMKCLFSRTSRLWIKRLRRPRMRTQMQIKSNWIKLWRPSSKASEAIHRTAWQRARGIAVGSSRLRARGRISSWADY